MYADEFINLETLLLIKFLVELHTKFNETFITIIVDPICICLC